MATKKVTRSKSKTPAEVLRDAKARAAAAVKMPASTNAEARVAVAAHAAAGRDVNELRIPMTFGQLCKLLGQNIEPETFASTVLDSLGDQLETTAAIVDNAPDFSCDSWRLFKNIAERAKYAGQVVRWLESEKPAELPEVQP